jgi:thiamine pyrophosphate-dependent acetolactate synthase large subunit-like protein
VLAADTLETDLTWAAETMDGLMQPVALLVPPGVVDIGKAGHRSTPVAMSGTARTDHTRASMLPPTLLPKLSRLDAIAAARKAIGREAVVHANGYMCRESFSLGDRRENFYMIGSMGLASAIGLGLALTDRRAPTVVLDGDGNLLMNLGILPLAAALRPPGFVHVVFDNEVYGSTGSQRSITNEVRLDRLAEAAGYRTVAAVTEAEAITEAVRRALGSEGPHFVLAKVTTEEASVGRIPFTPHELRDRFRATVRA